VSPKEEITTMAELSPKQELFLEYLFNDPECQGDTKLAADRAGYDRTGHYQLVKALKNEILERTQLKMAMKAPTAASKLLSMMDEDGSVPKADIRLKAIESVLDRTGISKKQEMEVTTNNDSPLFFIPAKVMQEEPVVPNN
jgi:hypothetical protein